MIQLPYIVSKYTETALLIDNVKFRPLLDQDLHNPVDSMESFYKDLDVVFGWFSANPTNKERVRQLQALYVAPDSKLDGKSLPDLLIDMLTNKKVLLGEIVGKRGSGKTMLMNHVLTVHHNDLQINGTTWLRADIAKLHAINEELITQERITPDKCLTINQYMVLHAASVMIEYAKDDLVFTHSLAEEKDWGDPNKPSPIEIKLANRPHLAQAWKIIRCADSQRRARLKAGQLKKLHDQDVKWLFKELYHSVNIELLEELFRALHLVITESYLLATGRASRIIFIFDGIDNIRSDEHAPPEMQLANMSARAWYGEYLKQLRQYILTAGSCLPADSYFFAIRDDTAKELTNSPLAHQQKVDEQPRQLKIEIPDFNDIFKRKFEFALSSVNYCEDPNNPGGKNERMEQFKWFYGEFVNLHIDAIRTVSRLHVRPFTVNDVITTTFNQNIRSFSRNIIRSFAYLKKFSSKHLDYRNCSSAEERLAFLKIHKSLIIEGSVLSGNRYMRLNFDHLSKGRWCPNFFEFEESTDHRWNGLSMLRVLQSTYLVEDDRPAPTMTEVKERLGAMGYTEHCVQVAIYTCLEYGLLTLGNRVNNHESGISEFTLNKTEKGAYLPTLIFSNAAVLYLVGTGAVYSGVSTERVVDISSNSYLHRADPMKSAARFFGVSAIRTGAMLLRHIISANERDLASARANNLRISEGEFNLPSFSKLMNSFQQLANISASQGSESQELILLETELCAVSGIRKD